VNSVNKTGSKFRIGGYNCLQRKRLGDVAVFENRQPEPLLNKVTKVDVKNYRPALSSA
jgi:hypothetical protein